MITMYSKPNCPYCDAAKMWFIENEFQFSIVDVSTNPEALAFLKEQGHRTVPQLYQGTTLLVEGGFNGLTKLGATKLREILT